MDQLKLILDFTILIGSGLLITKAIKIFIDSTTKLAHILNISGYTISFLLVSLATSLPELFVSITSSIEKNSIISYGNAIGSNLALITIIVAIPVLAGRAVSTKNVVKSNDIYYGAAFLVIALIFAINGKITRPEGLFLIAGYFVYIKAVMKRGSLLESIVEKFDHTNAWKQLIFFCASLFLLLISSQGIVNSAIDISKRMDINLGYVGLTIIALGTSLPEIAFGVGLLKNHKRDNGEILGDIVGSIVANSTLVLGTAAAIYPIDLAESKMGAPTIIFLVSTLLLFLVFSKTDYKINKKEAFVLLTVYLLFLGAEFILVS